MSGTGESTDWPILDVELDKHLPLLAKMRYRLLTMDKRRKEFNCCDDHFGQLKLQQKREINTQVDKQMLNQINMVDGMDERMLNQRQVNSCYFQMSANEIVDCFGLETKVVDDETMIDVSKRADVDKQITEFKEKKTPKYCPKKFDESPDQRKLTNMGFVNQGKQISPSVIEEKGLVSSKLSKEKSASAFSKRKQELTNNNECSFETANDKLYQNQLKKSKASEDSRDCNSKSEHSNNSPMVYGNSDKHLGNRKPFAPFQPPVKRNGDDDKENVTNGKPNEELTQLLQNELLKNIDPKMIEHILNEVVDNGTLNWQDIAGLQFAKKKLEEIIVWPLLRPDIFTGIRRPPKGLLLFGPPGTGKTLIGKCIAAQSNSKFFSISASSLTSKWIGEGEKLVRAMFAVARCLQPAVIFIDEVDSLLTQRNDTEHESSRRLKTEFLVQFDGVGTKNEDRLLIIGATNRPQELDEAARRRFSTRLYIPLPEFDARIQIIQNCLKNEKHNLNENELDQVSTKTQGFSGADMTHLCREAAMVPLRQVEDIQNIDVEDIRPISFEDFNEALDMVKASVAGSDLVTYKKFNEEFGISCEAKKSN